MKRRNDFFVISLCGFLGAALMPGWAWAEAVLAVPQSVARAVNDYSSDPSHLLAWRARLADMIEELASMKVSEQ
ncbi:MAG TPA: hypothetical protein P5026_09110 [Kiritimatiellia bacterium]|nr:hypothetical protein [Kiritimatiellia bacterium]HRU70732.1 hypothetical protein [Kiritimatiellia bacterium]